MRNVEKDMLARVTSISRLVTLVACATGPVFGGILSEEFGIRGAMAGLFLITAALPVFSFVASSAAGPRGYSMDRQEVAVLDNVLSVGQS
jgi:MFS family permease